MKYVQLRAGCHDLLIAVTEVAQILASAPEGAAVVQLCAAPCVFIRCVDGRVLGVDEARPIIAIPDAALLPVPWLPTALASLFDAFVAAPPAWRLKPGWSTQP